MKTMIMVCLALLSAMVSTVWAEDPVYFADPVLKAAVEDELSVSNPTPSDMFYLPSLTVNFANIQSLVGLEYATNLQHLDVHDNRILSVSPLSGLTGLTYLDLNNNLIGNISPLSGLTNLTYLNLHDQLRDYNKFTDISALAGMSKLKTLHIYRHRISDISVLAGMTQLEDLELGDNRISDLSPLSGLSNLRRLKLYDNPISDLSPLTGLTSLRNVVLWRTELSHESCSVHIPQIKANNPGVSIGYDCAPVGSHSQSLTVSSTIGGSVTFPGEGTFTYNHGQGVQIRAFANAGYSFSGWTGDITSDQNIISINMNQDYTIKANFSPLPMPVSDVIYVDPNGSGDPGPFDPNLSDPDENGTTEHPFDRIQEAIEASVDGSSIKILPGTYYENIDFQGKNLKLIGLEPNDPNAKALPVINGQGTGPVVSFVGGEDANSLLQGLVVTGGGVAVRCMNSSPMLSHCLIVGNQPGEVSDAVIDCSSGTLKIVHCTIVHNKGLVKLIDSGLDMSNSIVWGNISDEIALFGDSIALISYSNVPPSNHPFQVVVDNIYVDPLFVGPGYWDDTVWLMGDYHLQAQAGRWDEAAQTWMIDDTTSPCIDTGDPIDSVGSEPVPHGGRVNMGVYGGTGVASRSYVLDGGIVYFSDPVLKESVEDKLKVTNPTVADIEGLLELDVTYNSIAVPKISDLTGLEYAVSLQTLILRGNSVIDISPIVDLNNLLYLDLSDNLVSDISALSSMTQLKELDVHGNGISDISALSNLIALEKLVLKKNQLEGGLWALENLTSLEVLNLEKNEIYALSGLHRMTKLRELDLSGNGARNIGILSNFEFMEYLYLNDNLISNIASLTGLTRLRKVDLKGNPLNQEAYDSHLQMIVDNNPGIQLSYDPGP